MLVDGVVDCVVEDVGAGVVGAGVDVVGVVVSGFDGSLLVVSVGVLVVCEPSVELPLVSAASAPVESGPNAVKPPPANAEMKARQAHLRRVLASIMRRIESSSGRPMVVVGAASPQTRGTPVRIHIGRQP